MKQVVEAVAFVSLQADFGPAHRTHAKKTPDTNQEKQAHEKRSGTKNVAASVPWKDDVSNVTPAVVRETTSWETMRIRVPAQQALTTHRFVVLSSRTSKTSTPVADWIPPTNSK
jgi:hypothetical protein